MDKNGREILPHPHHYCVCKSGYLEMNDILKVESNALSISALITESNRLHVEQATKEKENDL